MRKNMLVPNNLFKIREPEGYFPSELWGEDSTFHEFKDIFKKHNHGKLIETKGVLSKVWTPKDYTCFKETCPQCNGHISERVVIMERGTNTIERQADVCPMCTEYTVEGNLYSNDAECCIMEMREEVIDYSIQQLLFKHQDTNRSLLVGYVGDHEFLQRDIGNEYLIKGVINRISSIDFPYILQTDTINLLESEAVDISLFENKRDIPGYDEWRKHILSRDKVCVVCGGDKNLQAHHLFGYKENPDLRLHSENGVAVCEWCHNKYHAYFGVKGINPVDFIKFIHRFGGRY